MEYRRLGKTGLQVSALSMGTWTTFGRKADLIMARTWIGKAIDRGVNFFDTAEAYADGLAELILGEALRSYPRSEIVVSTKIFWGGAKPNQEGLSRKHILEGTTASLRRLQMEYVDLLYCHRSDPDVPMEEVVRAMDHIVRAGQALYWGTSEWSADEIKQAHSIAAQLGCIPPVVEQPEYNMFVKARVEKEYPDVIRETGMGLTTWSPLKYGVLSDRYLDGLPEDSRLKRLDWLRKALTPERIEAVKKLQPIAESIHCTLPQLAIAWCLKNADVSSVILGGSSWEQWEENFGALKVAEILDDERMLKIREVIGTAKDI